MQRLFTLLFILLCSLSGYSQSKVPAIFNDYNRFVTEFSKLSEWEWYIANDNSCYRYNAWKKVYKDIDSLTAEVTISSPNNNRNRIKYINIFLSDNKDFQDDINQKKLYLVLGDVRKVINDSRFSKINLFSNYYSENIVKDPMTTLITDFKIMFVSGSIENGPTTFNYALSLSFNDPEFYIEDSPPVFLENDTTTLTLPKPELPDSTPSNPQTLFQAALNDNSIIITCVENLMGDSFKLAYEDDYSLDYSINSNPKFNCITKDTTESNIEFTLHGDCFETGGFLNLSYECSGQKPEPASWAHYLLLADSIAGYLNLDKPVVYTNYNIGKYTYASQTISPTYKKCVKYSFGKSNCYLPCGVMDKTYFSADIYFCGCSFEYIK